MQAARLVGIGLVVGGGLAFGVAKLLQSQLFGVGPADPLTYGAIGVLVIGVGLVASLLPARRAAGVDPVRVLRSE
jgi:ABC-type antimicrobial peptide transport system permease subunit